MYLCILTPILLFIPQFIIMVIDSTDRERLAVTREELYRMLQHEDLSKASLLVYANKQVGDGFASVFKWLPPQFFFLMKILLIVLFIFCGRLSIVCRT